MPFGIYRAISADLLAGKIVGNTYDYFPERDGRMPEVKTDVISTSEILVQHLSQSRVVRALKNLAFVSFIPQARPAGGSKLSAQPVAGDDPDVKAQVIDFLNRIGYDSVHMDAYRVCRDSCMCRPSKKPPIAPLHHCREAAEGVQRYLYARSTRA